MFDYEPKREESPPDYTGLKLVVLVAPVFFFFACLGEEDMGLSVSIVLGLILLAIKLRWGLRKHIWFWGAIALVFVLHIPLLIAVRWPQGNFPTLAYTLPVGIVDFLLILGAIDLARKIFPKGSSSDQEQ
jgi:hypothetical protein